MRTMQLAGQTIPVIGQGTWRMGDQIATRSEEIAALQTGIRNGATVIDTAEMYGDGNAELLVGKAIKPFQRDQLFLISKVLPEHANPVSLTHSLNASLRRLKTDYLDLYLYHWRGDTPLQTTVDELMRQQQAGKIRRWGVSNFDVADMLELLQCDNGNQVAANEVLYNLGRRGIDYDLAPWLARQQIPLIAYSPIAQGDRFHHNLATAPIIQKLAADHAVSPFTILLAWTIRNPQVLTIPQSSQQKHVLSNIAAADIQLSRTELAAIDNVFPKPQKKERLAVL